MLRSSKDRLEKENSVTAIFFKAQRELDARKQLYDEFRKKLTDEELASLDDENIKVPLQRYLTIMAVGFFAGKAPIYKIHAYDEEIDKLNQELFARPANDEQKVKEMQYILKHVTDYNDDKREFFDLALDYFVKRACYEILYKNEQEEYVYSRSDALETVAIWDYSVPKNLIGLYRIIRTTTADNDYQIMIELITENGKRYYLDTPEKRKLFGTPGYTEKFKDEPLFTENKAKYQKPLWDDVPAIVIENEHGLNIFENVDSLIKAYERVIQNSRNTFQYNDEAKLKVVGYSPKEPAVITDKKGNAIINPLRVKEDEYNLKSRVVYIEQDGDVDWILKSIDDAALQNHKKTLMDLICLSSFCPNMTDLGFTSADNNSALEKKFFSLQQYIATFEGLFLQGLKRRWEIILNKFNKDKSKHYDFRDIEIKLNRNVPSDRATDVTNALKLRGLLSDETVINALNMDLDAKNELEKMDLQNQENIEKNLEQMQKMGQVGMQQENTSTETNTEDKAEITDLTDNQRVQKLTADNKKKQEKQVNKQLKKE